MWFMNVCVLLYFRSSLYVYTTFVVAILLLRLLGEGLLNTFAYRIIVIYQYDGTRRIVSCNCRRW